MFFSFRLSVALGALSAAVEGRVSSLHELPETRALLSPPRVRPEVSLARSNSWPVSKATFVAQTRVQDKKERAARRLQRGRSALAMSEAAANSAASTPLANSGFNNKFEEKQHEES